MLALCAAACGRPGTADGAARPPAAYIDVAQLEADAQAEMQAGRWTDAAGTFRRQAEAASREPALAGWRRVALYNVACAEMRAGRRADAVAAFAESIDGGMPVRVAWAGGKWLVLPGLTLPHVLADPDLDPIRDEAGFREALRPYLDSDWTPEPAAAETPTDATAGGPVMLVLWTGGDPAQVRAVFGPGTRTVAPPLALRGTASAAAEHGWVLADGDVRWGAARVRREIERAAAESPAGVHVVATNEITSAVAWTAVLEVPEKVAGFALAGVSIPRPAWAGALAEMPRRRAGLPPWKVVLGPKSDVAAAALEAAGAVVTRVAAKEEFAAAVRDAWK